MHDENSTTAEGYGVASASRVIGEAVINRQDESLGKLDELVLDVGKDKLTSAPGFDADATWPDLADRTWGSGIHSYYGQSPYWN